MDAFMGCIIPVGFNYPPRGWLFCNGQTIPIQQNAALFALLGVMYGGDGQNTFGIPDLRGRTIFGSQQQGPGLMNIPQGAKAGTNTTTVVGTGAVNFTLNTNNLPAHNHSVSVVGSAFTATSTLNATTQNTGATAPVAGATLSSTAGLSGAPQAAIYQAATPPTNTLVPLNPASVTTTVGGTANVTSGNTGSGTAIAAPVTTSANISIMPPYLGLNFILCQEGIFPSRN